MAPWWILLLRARGERTSTAAAAAALHRRSPVCARHNMGSVLVDDDFAEKRHTAGGFPSGAADCREAISGRNWHPALTRSISACTVDPWLQQPCVGWCTPVKKMKQLILRKFTGRNVQCRHVAGIHMGYRQADQQKMRPETGVRTYRKQKKSATAQLVYDPNHSFFYPTKFTCVQH